MDQMIQIQQQFIQLQQTISSQNTMTFNDVWVKINHLNLAMRTQEKSKLPSLADTSTLGKIESINAISSTLDDDIPEMTPEISFRSGKRFDEPVSKNNNN